MYIYHLFLLKCILSDISFFFSHKLVSYFPEHTEGHKLHIYLASLSLHLQDLLLSFVSSKEPALRSEIESSPSSYRVNLIEYYFKHNKSKAELPSYLLDISYSILDLIQGVLNDLQRIQITDTIQNQHIKAIACIIVWFAEIFRSDTSMIEQDLKSLRRYIRNGTDTNSGASACNIFETNDDDIIVQKNIDKRLNYYYQFINKDSSY